MSRHTAREDPVDRQLWLRAHLPDSLCALLPSLPPVMASVKEAVKETLIGTTVEPQLSAQMKATFDKHSRKDDETGERYMLEQDFVNAIAPAEEDYVGPPTSAAEILPRKTSC